VTALVCHGTCALLETRLSTGELLVTGKTWTGFANSEERFADSFVGQRLQPFWIEDEARGIPESNFIVTSAFGSSPCVTACSSPGSSSTPAPPPPGSSSRP
jgi:putative intracellular protease/amidase